MKMTKKEMIEKHPLGIILLGTLLGAMAAFGGSFLVMRVLQMTGFTETLHLHDVIFGVVGIAGIISYLAILIWEVRTQCSEQKNRV